MISVVFEKKDWVSGGIAIGANILLIIIELVSFISISRISSWKRYLFDIYNILDIGTFTFVFISIAIRDF